MLLVILGWRKLRSDPWSRLKHGRIALQDAYVPSKVRILPRVSSTGCGTANELGSRSELYMHDLRHRIAG
jgi:hypothetical protein